MTLPGSAPWLAEHDLSVGNLEEAATADLAQDVLQAIGWGGSARSVLVARTAASPVTLFACFKPLRQFSHPFLWYVLACLDSGAQTGLMRVEAGLEPPPSASARALHASLSQLVQDLPTPRVIQLLPGGRILLAVAGAMTAAGCLEIRDRMLALARQLPRPPGHGIDGL